VPETLDPKEQYVWSIRYIDAPVLRDRDTDDDGDLDERLYYTNDANMNVTALVEPDGDVVERVTYTPYGKPSFFDASWNPRAESAYANAILYCGYYFDSETGLYHVRYRYYDPPLGRWLSRDPGTESTTTAPRASAAQTVLLGDFMANNQYRDGMNLYQDRGSCPTGHVDAFGLKKCKWTGRIEGTAVGAILSAYQSMTVSAHGKDDVGCCYAIRAEDSAWFTGAGLFVGVVTLGADFEDYEAECEWPIKDGDPASLALMGVGAAVGPVPVNLALVQAFAGEILVFDGPFEVGGLNVFIAGGGFAVTDLKVTHRSGPTPCSE